MSISLSFKSTLTALLFTLSLTIPFRAYTADSFESSITTNIEAMLQKKINMPGIAHFYPTSLPQEHAKDPIDFSQIRISIPSRTLSLQTTKGAWIKGTFSYEVSVPVLNRPLRASETLTSDMLNTKNFEINRLPNDVVLHAEQIMQYFAKTYIRANVPIRYTDLSAPLDVHKNDIIQIIYRCDGITISTKAMAMQNGHKSEKIKVRNIKSNKLIEGLIIDKNTVSVS